MFVKGPNWSAGHDTGTKVRKKRVFSFFFAPAFFFTHQRFNNKKNPPSKPFFQDSLFTLSRPIAGGDLDVVQAVPGGRWFLVPSPLLRFTRKFVGGDDGGDGGDDGDGKGGRGSSVAGFSGLTGSRGTDVLVAEFDNLTRRSAISQTSYLGDGFKAGICVDSLNVRF